MSDVIHAGSLVTLRYRLSCEGKELVSTMDRPLPFDFSARYRRAGATAGGLPDRPVITPSAKL